MRVLLVLTCAAVTAAFPPPYKNISCSDVKPSKNVSIPELRGGWVALESMSLMKKGVAKSAICVHSELLNTTTSTLTMLSELHRPGTDDIDIARNNFEVLGDKQEGRWRVISKRPQLRGAEMLVFTVDPASYMVLALCLPQNTVDNTKYLSSITLMARRHDRGSRGFLSEHRLVEIRVNMAKQLGIPIEPMQYDTSC